MDNVHVRDTDWMAALGRAMGQHGLDPLRAVAWDLRMSTAEDSLPGQAGRWYARRFPTGEETPRVNHLALLAETAAMLEDCLYPV